MVDQATAFSVELLHWAYGVGAVLLIGSGVLVWWLVRSAGRLSS